MLITYVSLDYPTHPYYNMPVQGNPLSTGQLFSQPNFNQNYALMAQQQITAMHAAIQGNRISRGFPNDFLATRFHHMKSSNFHGGKLPLNIAPFMVAAFNHTQRPQQQQNFAGSEVPQRFSTSKLLDNKEFSIDELMKQVNKQIQEREKPEIGVQEVDNWTL